MSELGGDLIRHMQELLLSENPNDGYELIDFYLRKPVCGYLKYWSGKHYLGLKSHHLPTVWENTLLTLRKFVLDGKFEVRDDVTGLLILFGQCAPFDCLKGKEFRVDDGDGRRTRSPRLISGCDDRIDRIAEEDDEPGGEEGDEIDGGEEAELEGRPPHDIRQVILATKLTKLQRQIIQIREDLYDGSKCRAPSMAVLTVEFNRATGGKRNEGAVYSILQRARRKIRQNLDRYDF